MFTKMLCRSLMCLCLASFSLLGCSKEGNMFKQITDSKEIEARAMKNIDDYSTLLQGEKNENGHLVPNKDASFITTTPASYTISDVEVESFTWLGIPNNTWPYTLRVSHMSPRTALFDIGKSDSGDDVIKRKKLNYFAVGMEGYVLLENKQKLVIKNHIYSLVDPWPNAFAYFYVINSKGTILVGLTKHASRDTYKQRILLPPSGESYVDLVWKEEDKRSTLVSAEAQIIDNGDSRSFHYGYLKEKDNETIVLRKDKNTGDEIEVNIATDSWKKTSSSFLGKLGL